MNVFNDFESADNPRTEKIGFRTSPNEIKDIQKCHRGGSTSVSFESLHLTAFKMHLTEICLICQSIVI